MTGELIMKFIALISIFFTINTFAVCNDSDISGCKIDLEKCLSLADQMSSLDQQNMIRLQCIQNYGAAMTPEQCREVASMMNSEEEVERALNICL